MNNLDDDKKELMKLTEEQKDKIRNVIEDFSKEYFTNEPSNSKYITEYDLLMKRKEEEWKLSLLEDNESYQIEALLEMCDEYIEEKKNPKGFGVDFGLIMMFDMWLNECSFWPTNNPKLWKEWEKLKKIKVKRK